MTTKEYDKAHGYKPVQVECCLTCIHARRWGFENRYSEDPSDLTAMCLSEDAPKEPITFGGSAERKYVNPFHVCDQYNRDKEIK